MTKGCVGNEKWLTSPVQTSWCCLPLCLCWLLAHRAMCSPPRPSAVSGSCRSSGCCAWTVGQAHGNYWDLWSMRIARCVSACVWMSDRERNVHRHYNDGKSLLIASREAKVSQQNDKSGWVDSKIKILLRKTHCLTLVSLFNSLCHAYDVVFWMTTTYLTILNHGIILCVPIISYTLYYHSWHS